MPATRKPDAGMAEAAFEKRVKRRVSARVHEFFAVCPPGLRLLCHRELTGLTAPVKNIEAVPGGVTFFGKLMDACAANLWLRSPSRILMRLARFRAQHFSELEKKLQAMDWELFLPAGTEPAIQVTTHTSRLYHTDAVAQRCRSVIRAALGGNCTGDTQPRNDLQGQTLMVRSENNRFEVSLDMSGIPLFKRNIKKQVTAAPLRENLAFAILDALHFSSEDLLMDPMCGSGTFAIEGAMIQARVPPGFFRRFACEAWPAFSPAAFAHVKSMAAGQIRPGGPVFASDIDPGAVAATAANLAGHAFLSPVQVFQHDFFDLVPDRLTRKKGVLVLNPAYGRRLETTRDTKTFYKEVAQKLKTDFKGWRVGVIFPQKQFGGMNFLKLRPLPFFHGGLDLAAGIGTV